MVHTKLIKNIVGRICIRKYSRLTLAVHTYTPTCKQTRCPGSLLLEWFIVDPRDDLWTPWYKSRGQNPFSVSHDYQTDVMHENNWSTRGRGAILRPENWTLYVLVTEPKVGFVIRLVSLSKRLSRNCRYSKNGSYTRTVELNNNEENAGKYSHTYINSYLQAYAHTEQTFKHTYDADTQEINTY